RAVAHRRRAPPAGGYPWLHLRRICQSLAKFTRSILSPVIKSLVARTRPGGRALARFVLIARQGENHRSRRLLMKKSILWASSLLALALTAGSVQFTPTLRAQSQSQPPSAQQQPEQTQSRTFVGQIVQA